VTSRGDRREPIAKDDADRKTFFEILGKALQRFDAEAWAYCLMGNHYHLVLHTREANLSRLMRHINGVYTQRFNRRHHLVGHLFQGRFKAILVDRDSYLLAVCRYVDLNPVRARMVKRPEDYPWSSYRGLAGLAPLPDWLIAEPIYAQLSLGKSYAVAAGKYAKFVAQGGDSQLWSEHLRQQIYLGDEDFILRMQKHADIAHDGSLANGIGSRLNVSKTQSRAPVRASSLQEYAKSDATDKAQRNQNIADAFSLGGHSQTAIALAFGVSGSTVSRVVAMHERQINEKRET
jgi:putative transposase